MMMNRMAMCVAAGLICAVSSSLLAAQTVTAYVYWGDEWKANSGASAYVSPVKATIQTSGSSSSATFTATTFEGWKVSKWLTATSGNYLSPMMIRYGRYAEHPGSESYDWTCDSALGTTPALAVRFDPIVYSLEFDPNGGTGSMNSQTNTYTNVYQLATCAFTRPGYRFDQWNASGVGTFSAGAQITSGKDLGVTEDEQVVTLKALWKEAALTVSLDANGEGATVSSNRISVTYQGVYPTLPEPARSGYAFNGWYTAADGGTLVTAGTTCSQTADHTLYAHWLKLWTVTFRDHSLWDNAVITNIQVKEGASVTPPSAPLHGGYTFLGWQGWNDFSQIGQDRIYTASYSANSYQVCFHKNDGSGLENIQSDFKVGESKRLATGVFERPGYTFRGWAETAGSTTVKYADGAYVLNLAESGTCHLYAVWTANVYEITFNANGGVGTMSPTNFVYDQAQALPSNSYTWAGVDFLGWLSPDGRTYGDGEVVSNLTTGASVELKAQWSQYYHVLFDGNGATNVAPYVQRFENSSDVKPLLDNRYARTGYAFAGWATNRSDAAARLVTYTNNAVYRSSVDAPGVTNRLFAVWSNNHYRVIFDGNGAESGTMTPQSFVYDEPQALRANAFVRDAEIWEFSGWTNRVSGAFYAEAAVVSNLTSEAEGEVTLHACWKSLLSDLSKAMKCTNLNWTSPGGRERIDGVWNPVATGVGLKGDSCAVMDVGETNGEMVATIKSHGLLHFYWKASQSSAIMYAELEGYYETSTNITATATVGEWNSVWIDTTTLIAKKEEIKFPITLYLGKDDSAGELSQGFVDCVSWYPGGVLPEPGEGDRPVVDGLSIGSGIVSVTVSNVSDLFDYRLEGTNDLAAPMPWPVLKSVSGVAGGTLGLTVPKKADEPKMFYTVEVIKRQ